SKYYDGGLSDPIPVRKAIADGNDKHLIILTQPEGYVKQLGKQNTIVGKLLKRSYPNLEKVLLTRHEVYNETLALCEQLEKEGQAIILRPKQSLDSFEKDVSKLKDTWQHGYDLATDNMAAIRKLLM
ncbi:MAG: patatin family protein, partial [Gorillibacterium sp.]|nr:patatin family protein [Gorillibacterium sp.]